MNSGKLLSNSGVATIFHAGKCLSFDPSHGRYNDLLVLLDEDKYDDLVKALDITKKVNRSFSQAGVEVKDGEVYRNGKVVHNAVCNRIVEFVESGRNPKNMVNFMVNLDKNPSMVSVEGLYRFLEHNKHPITEDGYFLAYKRVQEDFSSFCRGKNGEEYDNSPGKVVNMPRNQVEDDPKKTCAPGLHVASLDYARDSYQAGRGRLVVVKVDPEHVVSVPTDYNNGKMRVCEYEVLEELTDHYRSYTQDEFSTKEDDVYNDDLDDDLDDDYDDEDYDDWDDEDDDLDDDELDDEDDDEYDDRKSPRLYDGNRY